MGTIYGLNFIIDLSDRIYNNFINENRYTMFIDGLLVSLKLTVIAAIIGVLLGLIIGIFRIRRVPIITSLAESYVSIIRGTPANVQLIVIYFVIFASSRLDKVLIASAAFGINSAAYVSEIVRGGILSIDKGQMEAARSLGLSYAKSMRLVIVPQAIKNILPAIGNEFIVLLKETSVAGYIGMNDLARAGLNVRNITYDSFTSLIIVAYIYFLLTLGLSKLLGILERRLRASD